MTAVIQNNDEISWRKLNLVPSLLHSNPLPTMSSKDKKIRTKNIIQLLFKNDWSKFTFKFFFLYPGKRNYKESKSS